MSEFIESRTSVITPTSGNFRTHLNYVKCMRRLTDGLTICIHEKVISRLDPKPIRKFLRLSEITAQSIDGERGACEMDGAYAKIAAPWIPVKCYYQQYYLESILIYLLTGSRSGFGRGGHRAVRRAICESIATRRVSLGGTGGQEMATIVTYECAQQFQTPPGSTLGPVYHTLPECISSLRKLVSRYIEIDWMSSQSFTNYRTKVAQEEKRKNLLPKKLTLLDYFYWMRIKANYRDVDFFDFDTEIGEGDAAVYLTVYIAASKNYTHALTAAIQKLMDLRYIDSSDSQDSGEGSGA